MRGSGKDEEGESRLKAYPLKEFFLSFLMAGFYLRYILGRCTRGIVSYHFIRLHLLYFELVCGFLPYYYRDRAKTSLESERVRTVRLAALSCLHIYP